MLIFNLNMDLKERVLIALIFEFVCYMVKVPYTIDQVCIENLSSK